MVQGTEASQDFIPNPGEVYLHVVDGIGYVDWTATDTDITDLLTRCVQASTVATMTVSYESNGERKFIKGADFEAALQSKPEDLESFIRAKLSDLSDGENIKVLAIRKPPQIPS